MPDEAIAPPASLFGTTRCRQALRGYTHHETLDIYRKLPINSTLMAFVTTTYLIIRTVWRCAHQLQRWPWVEHEQFMRTPLQTLRAHFGFKVTYGHNSNT